MQDEVIYSKCFNVKQAVAYIKAVMAPEYAKLGLEWDDAKKLAQYLKCSLWEISKGGVVVGFFMVYEPADTYYLAELHIYPSFRGKGYGTMALSDIKQQAGQKGYSEISVGAFKHSKALDLYLRMDLPRKRKLSSPMSL